MWFVEQLFQLGVAYWNTDVATPSVWGGNRHLKTAVWLSLCPPRRDRVGCVVLL